MAGRAAPRPWQRGPLRSPPLHSSAGQPSFPTWRIRTLSDRPLGSLHSSRDAAGGGARCIPERLVESWARRTGVCGVGERLVCLDGGVVEHAKGMQRWLVDIDGEAQGQAQKSACAWGRQEQPGGGGVLGRR